MRLTLASRIVISVVGVVFLALLSSMAALLSSWQIGQQLHRTVRENVASVQAAGELEISLLEQRGFVSSYLLDDGNQEWLEELQRRTHSFDQSLKEACLTAHTRDEEKTLDDLNQVYQQYNARREEVVDLYKNGNEEAAENVLVDEVNELHDQAYKLCEKFLAANVRHVSDTEARVHWQIRWVTWAVCGCVVLTIGLGAALLWLFFSGVVVPLRTMVADARGFAGEIVPDGAQLPTDELRAVGIYLQNLMTDVADSRTTLEQSRRQLREAQKLASVGKLAASVAHEIRSPLTSLKMWLFSIQKEVGGDAGRDRKFEIVAEEIRRLENIVRHFLDFSRPPELNRSITPVSAILDRTFELLQSPLADRGISLVREAPQDLPPVLVDAEQFKQVLINLINNAAEAAGEGGRICLTAAVGAGNHARPMLVVRVRDNGPGIPEEVRSRIFEPFFTTKDEGTGLGLSIAARIMARHQGRLVLESSTPAGATFAIFLPLAPEQRP
jgi:signal transduction histidine kinase